MSLSNNFPAARPTLNLDFANVGALDPRITFTRASIGTFTGSNGLIQTAAAGVPRFDYDPVTRAAKGFLVEEQRTNLLINSGDLSSVATTGTVIRTPNQLTAPDGTLTGSIFTGNNVPAIATQSATATASTMTFSCYVKVGVQSSRSTYQFLMRNSTTALNFTTGTFSVLDGSITGSGWSSTYVGNAWYRLTYTNSVSQIINVGDLLTCYFGAIGGITYTTADSWGVWGGQLEAGAFATSYIPTVATQVTRSEDFARMTNVSPWYNAAQGTLFYEMTFDASYNYPVTPTFYQAASANGNIIGVYSNIATQFVGLIRSGAVNQASMGVTATVLGGHKVAIAYSAGSAAAVVDNLAVVTGTPATLPTIDTLGIAGLQSGYTQVGNAVGHIRRITYYPIRVSNAQLQALTS